MAVTARAAEAWMQAAPAPAGSNTAYGQRYGREIKQIIDHAARRAPRSMQRHLGPSELGTLCDRQVVGKLLAEPVTNHVADPWPSIVGTAVHAWLAAAFERENGYQGWRRFATELRVSPTDAHPGSTDMYDARDRSCVDWKILGPTSLAKIKRREGPPRIYKAQLLLYGLGCLRKGLPVERVVLIACPRTAATLDDLYVWDHPFGSPEDIALLREVLASTIRRKQIAEQVRMGAIRLQDVPITPDDSECFFCPFYRPASYNNPNEPGCPGTKGNRNLIRS